jgi:protein-S-isoprenylcysteine O-methyltransferase Ste14
MASPATGPLIRTVIFTLIAPTTVTVYVPYLLLPGGDFGLGAARYLGIPLIAAGAAIYLWCAWNFAWAGLGTPAPIDPPKKLVARGLYRHVRNPMYIGVLSILLGESLIFQSRRVLGFALLALAASHLFVICYEEPTLRRKFGAGYEEYCRAVPRWVPGWRRQWTRVRRLKDSS